MGEAGQVVLDREIGERVLGLLADDEKLALERVLIVAIFAAADDRLADHRHLVEHRLAEAGGVDRHVAPADQRLAFLGDEFLEGGDGEIARLVVARQEAHRDAIVAGLGQGEAGARRPSAQQAIGNLDEDAGAIAEQRIGTDRAAMIEREEDFEAALDDRIGLFTTNVRNEADPAGIMLVAAVVQTLILRIAHPAFLLPTALPIRTFGGPLYIYACASEDYRGDIFSCPRDSLKDCIAWSS